MVSAGKDIRKEYDAYVRYAVTECERGTAFEIQRIHKEYEEKLRNIQTALEGRLCIALYS